MPEHKFDYDVKSAQQQKTQLQIKISYHLINLRIASQQTTVKITAMISKIKNSVQDIPIKSSRNTLKNSTKYYKNIITKRQLVYR